MQDSKNFKNDYADVNGLKMYYEIYGEGKPLVLIHGGGSTIQTTFDRIIPQLAKHRKIIAADMQAHGRTGDRNAYLTFAQDADDIAKLLEILQMKKADILGFSNGGQTAIEIALRHPEVVDKLILCSTFYKRSAVATQFWEGFDGIVPFSSMPQLYKDEFLKVNNNPDALLNMFNRDVQRMSVFKGWSDEQMKSIKAPTLVVNGNEDVGSIEHSVEMYRIIPNCQIAVFPGGHGAYLGEIMAGFKDDKLLLSAVSLFEDFLDK